jgi:hypothetical protein
MTSSETVLHAGVARADITPPVGIAHGNWGASTHSRAEGIDLPLWATVLAVRDISADVTAVIVECDLLGLSFAQAGAIRDAVSRTTGLPRDHIRISVSHTHSGPTINTGTWLQDGAELIEGYVASLAPKIAGAAWQALQSLQPARFAFGTGESHIGINRRFRPPQHGRVLVGRNPDGFFDPTVRVLRVDTAGGAPLACLLHYATHPTIMAYENRLITPDYPGPARRTVEAATGATCLFLQGCAGNAGPRIGFTEGRTGALEDYHRAGRILGAEAAAVFMRLEPQPFDPVFTRVQESGAPLAMYHHAPRPAAPADAAVRVLTTTAFLPVRPFPTREEAERRVSEAREALAAVRRRGGSDAEIQEATWRAKRTSQQTGHARLTDGRPEVEVELHAIRIGPAAIVGAPMEVFGELGHAVAQASPFAWTAVTGYTNGSAGYLPTAEAHAEGGYEVEMASPFAPEAAPRYVDAASALLQQLHSLP